MDVRDQSFTWQKAQISSLDMGGAARSDALKKIGQLGNNKVVSIKLGAYPKGSTTTDVAEKAHVVGSPCIQAKAKSAATEFERSPTELKKSEKSFSLEDKRTTTPPISHEALTSKSVGAGSIRQSSSNKAKDFFAKLKAKMQAFHAKNMMSLKNLSEKIKSRHQRVTQSFTNRVSIAELSQQSAVPKDTGIREAIIRAGNHTTLFSPFRESTDDIKVVMDSLKSTFSRDKCVFSDTARAQVTQKDIKDYKKLAESELKLLIGNIIESSDSTKLRDIAKDLLIFAKGHRERQDKARAKRSAEGKPLQTGDEQHIKTEEDEKKFVAGLFMFRAVTSEVSIAELTRVRADKESLNAAKEVINSLNTMMFNHLSNPSENTPEQNAIIDGLVNFLFPKEEEMKA